MPFAQEICPLVIKRAGFWKAVRVLSFHSTGNVLLSSSCFWELVYPAWRLSDVQMF